MVVQHEHVPAETAKFLGEVQSPYPRKNWSPLVLFNCGRCRALTPVFVNVATGLEMHRFLWLGDDALIGALPQGRWNHLVDVQAHSHGWGGGGRSGTAAMDSGRSLVP
jgi:hypothetical protein